MGAGCCWSTHSSGGGEGEAEGWPSAGSGGKGGEVLAKAREVGFGGEQRRYGPRRGPERAGSQKDGGQRTVRCRRRPAWKWKWRWTRKKSSSTARFLVACLASSSSSFSQISSPPGCSRAYVGQFENPESLSQISTIRCFVGRAFLTTAVAAATRARILSRVFARFILSLLSSTILLTVS